VNFVYVVAVSSAGISGGYYHVVQRAGPLMQPLPGFGSALFHFSGAVSAFLLLGLLIGGFFIGPWWQPFAALVMGLFLSGLVVRVAPSPTIGRVVLFMLVSLILSVLLFARYVL